MAMPAGIVGIGPGAAVGGTCVEVGGACADDPACVLVVGVA